MPRQSASNLKRQPAHECQGYVIPFPRRRLQRSRIAVSNCLAYWQSLQSPFCSGGQIVSERSLGSDFRGYANQEAHYTDLKQIPLRQTHSQELLRCDVKVKQASTYQCDPTDVIGNSSNQP